MLQSRAATEEEIKLTGLIHRVYVPEEGAAGRPLVVMVHGRDGDANVMWVFSKALSNIRPVIVSPQAFIKDNLGFSWWPVREKLAKDAPPELRRERLREVQVGVRRLSDFIKRFSELHAIDAKRIYAFGFSQGGAAIGTLSLMEPGIFQGVALLSSFIPYAVLGPEASGEEGLVNQQVKAGQAKLPPYFMFHGTGDQIIPIERAKETKEGLEKMGAELTWQQDTVSHKVSASGIAALAAWIERLCVK